MTKTTILRGRFGVRFRVAAARAGAAFAVLALALLSPLSALAGLHHVHLASPDTKAAAEWYAKHLGGEVRRVADQFDATAFGDVLILFLEREGSPGSQGSAIDHIGFSFPDLVAKMDEFRADGVKIVAPIVKLPAIDFAFIEDPWGTKIEVMRDPNRLGFHHVHLMTDNPPETIRWYGEAFGGKVEVYQKILHSAEHENFWFIAQPTPKELAPTFGRSIDHFAWAVEDLDAEFARLTDPAGLAAKAIEAPHAFGPSRRAWVEGPHGVRIELIEAP